MLSSPLFIAETKIFVSQVDENFSYNFLVYFFREKQKMIIVYYCYFSKLFSPEVITNRCDNASLYIFRAITTRSDNYSKVKRHAITQNRNVALSL